MTSVDKVHEGMGANLHTAGVAFRVWAPHATAVFVKGDFNDWSENAHPMNSENNGYWYVSIKQAKAGQEYKYIIQNGDQTLERIDPYAREVTNSSGNGVIYDPSFDWKGDDFQIPAHNELIIYEMHIGSFFTDDSAQPGDFHSASDKFEHLRHLGVNALQIMPIAEFAGDYSWGYNPAHIFAVESAYGGPNGFKRFVREAHKHGFAVILDVVYNHFGPSDLDLWQFDGWQENGMGGIYFYNDWRAQTPWGDTRPDYGRGEVRQFIRDNALMWLKDYHVDGLRYDMTLYMRSVRGEAHDDLPDGWNLTQWINGEIRSSYPGRICIAEDLRNNEWLTKHPEEGGAGFHAQWDANFVHPVRAVITTADDKHRSMAALQHAILFNFNGDAFRRIIYSESHDEVANGKARVPHEIDANDPTGWYAQKRSTLASSLVFTSPGIPMLFQGQEFLQGEWFRDDVPLDWEQNNNFSGIVKLYRDLAHLRLNRNKTSRGLCGQFASVFHIHEDNNMIAFQRWDQHGPGDDVVVVVNLGTEPREGYEIGMPEPGLWRLRFNSDANIYSDDFGNFPSTDVEAAGPGLDGLDARAAFSVGPYSLLIYSKDK